MLSKNAITVLEKRYLLKDESGSLCETPEGLFKRVAYALADTDRLYGADDAQVEATAQAFYDLTYNLDFVPECYGKWAVTGGVTYYYLGEGTSDFNTAARGGAVRDFKNNEWVFSGGLVLNF